MFSRPVTLVDGLPRGLAGGGIHRSERQAWDYSAESLEADGTVAAVWWAEEWGIMCLPGRAARHIHGKARWADMCAR